MIFQPNFEYVLDPSTGEFISFHEISNYDDNDQGYTRATFPSRNMVIRGSNEELLNTLGLVDDRTIHTLDKDRYIEATLELTMADGTKLISVQKIPAGRMLEIKIAEQAIHMDWFSNDTVPLSKAKDAIEIADLYATAGNGVVYDNFMDIANELISNPKC